MFQSTPEERDSFPEMKGLKGGVQYHNPPKHPTGKVCKHCGVDVYVVGSGKWKRIYPILGKQHKPSCPRARNCN